MATKEKKTEAEQMMEENLTVATPLEEKVDTTPRVQIYLPRLEEDGSVAVDQTEHVTIANENGPTKRWRVLRGERVDVPVDVFVAMKEKYPDL